MELVVFLRWWVIICCCVVTSVFLQNNFSRNLFWSSNISESDEFLCTWSKVHSKDNLVLQQIPQDKNKYPKRPTEEQEFLSWKRLFLLVLWCLPQVAITLNIRQKTLRFYLKIIDGCNGCSKGNAGDAIESDGFSDFIECWRFNEVNGVNWCRAVVSVVSIESMDLVDVVDSTYWRDSVDSSGWWRYNGVNWCKAVDLVVSEFSEV